MAASYSKDFLIAAYTFPYDLGGLNTRIMQRDAERFYDEVGRDKFRVYASLDAARVAEFKKFCLEHSLEI